MTRHLLYASLKNCSIFGLNGYGYPAGFNKGAGLIEGYGSNFGNGFGKGFGYGTVNGNGYSYYSFQNNFEYSQEFIDGFFIDGFIDGLDANYINQQIDDGQNPLFEFYSSDQ
jgi:hypothetical protein